VESEGVPGNSQAESQRLWGVVVRSKQDKITYLEATEFTTPVGWWLDFTEPKTVMNHSEAFDFRLTDVSGTVLNDIIA